jgi:hypothetical protein
MGGDPQALVAGQEKEGTRVTTPPVAFTDFPEEAFPFTIELLNEEREIVWAVTVDGPGVVSVPGPDVTGPGRKTARITYADGTVDEA